MSATYIQSVNTGNIAFGGSTVNVAFSGGNTAHSTILVYVALANENAGTVALTVTDSNNGSVYVQVGSYVDVATGGPSSSRFAVFMAADVLAGANTVHVTPSHTALGGAIIISEYSGNVAASPLIGSNSPGGAHSSTPSVTLTTTITNQTAVIYYFEQTGGAGTVGYPSGFTLRNGVNPVPSGIAYLQVDKLIASPSTATYSFTQTDASAWSWAFGVVITDAPLFTFVPQAGAFLVGF